MAAVAGVVSGIAGRGMAMEDTSTRAPDKVEVSTREALVKRSAQLDDRRKVYEEARAAERTARLDLRDAIRTESDKLSKAAEGSTQRDDAEARLRELERTPLATFKDRHDVKRALSETWTLSSASLAVGKWFDSNFDRIDFATFQPKARVFFDLGTDRPGKLDIFRNGGLTPTIEIGEVRLLNYLDGKPGKTVWGLTLGAGIGAPASSSDDANASAAPLVLLSTGIVLAHQIDDNPDPKKGNYAGIEFGYSLGITTDDTLADTTDDAVYAAVVLHLSF